MLAESARAPMVREMKGGAVYLALDPDFARLAKQPY